MDHTLLKCLRHDLNHLGYTQDWVNSLLPSDVLSLLLGGVASPASAYMRQLSSLEPRHAVARLFLLGEHVSGEEVEQAFINTGVEGLLELGLLIPVENEPTQGVSYRAALSLTPVESPQSEVSWWILSDLDDHLRTAPAHPQHVMGVGKATRSLICALPVSPVERALDLGTGNGLVALWLTSIAQQVVASDISDRALMFAEANATLNDVNITLARGNLFEPVGEDRFDLIATNPPFVIEPVTSEVDTYVYRSSGKPGDSLLCELLSQATQFLTPQGKLVSLVNWEHIWGESAEDKIFSFVPEAGKKVSVSCIERGMQTPLEYASMWLRDSGLTPSHHRYDVSLKDWVQDFMSRRVTDIRFGYLTLINEPDRSRCFTRYERIESPLNQGQPFGAAWEQQLAGIRQITRMDTDTLFEQHFSLAPGVEEHRRFIPGTEQILEISLVQRSGIERYFTADTVTAALFGACDGQLSAKTILEALSVLLSVDPEEISSVCEQALRDGVAQGFLTFEQ